jgi:class 3 adenylate cyclase
MVILFADIVGCSEVSNHMTLGQYNEFLQEFHRVFDLVTKEHKESFYSENEYPYFKPSVRGDEGCLMIFLPHKDEAAIAEDLDTAILIALDLKRRWLLCDENRRRIEVSGLLPIELAIGIHLGRAYINGDKDNGFSPEGYAINLTKRIEGESRKGHYTHIFVSEAAHVELDKLTDEQSYTFAPAEPIEPKGISHDIQIFEVKHHFLPTDWNEVSAPGKHTRALSFEPEDDEVAVARKGYQENPTNLWLAEEYIMLLVQREYEKLVERGDEDDKDALKAAYKPAQQVCQRLATGDHRDAGVLTIAGFIEGEMKDYKGEQRRYREALDIDPQYAEANWYLAYSMSTELFEGFEGADESPDGFDDLSEQDQNTVVKILEHYERASDLKPQQAWIKFDLAAERARWNADKNLAVRELQLAVALNSTVGDKIKSEPYFEDLLEDPRVKKLLPTSE